MVTSADESEQASNRLKTISEEKQSLWAGKGSKKGKFGKNGRFYLVNRRDL